MFLQNEFFVMHIMGINATYFAVRGQRLDKICNSSSHDNTLTDEALSEQIMLQAKYKQQNNVVEKLQRQLVQARMRHENRIVRRIRSGKSRKLAFADSATSLRGLLHYSMFFPQSSLRTFFHSDITSNSLQSNVLNSNKLFNMWDPNETATRQVWIDRFRSVEALDALSEESTAFRYLLNYIYI